MTARGASGLGFAASRRQGWILALAVLVAIATIMCGGSPTRPDRVEPPPQPPPPVPPPPPMLSVTRFVAFGDSLTEGVLSLETPALGLAVLPDQGYPAKLHVLLTARYTAQVIAVVNEGRAGERAEQGVRRLSDVLRSLQPDVLLLMEGTNDLASGASGIAAAAIALEKMIRTAHASGVHVMLATVPPQRPGGFRASAAALVPPLNDEIRKIAVDERAILVDVYEGFRGDLSLLGSDGLHPTEVGYQRIADVFFDAIRINFESPSPLTSRLHAHTQHTPVGGSDTPALRQ